MSAVRAKEPEVKEHRQCLCGTVRLKATIGAREIFDCYCTMQSCESGQGCGSDGVFLAAECRHALGENMPHLGVDDKSDWSKRYFCKVYGTDVIWRTTDGAHKVFSVQGFSQPSYFMPAQQAFIDEKAASYSFAEATSNIGPEFIAMITSAEQQQ